MRLSRTVVALFLVLVPSLLLAQSPTASTKPVDSEKEKEAIAFLKERELEASVDQLLRSAHESKADEVRALLDAGVAVDGDGDDQPLIMAMDACSEEGETPAIIETVDALVSGGANVKRLDDNKNTPMITAAQYCGAKVVKRLVAAGADVNIVNGSGVTPLMIALIMSHFDAAEELVASGATLTADQADVIKASVKDPRADAIVQKATAAKKKPAKKK